MPLVGLLSRAFLSCFLFKSYFCNIIDIRQIFTYMCADFHQPMFYGQNNYHMIIMYHPIEKKIFVSTKRLLILCTVCLSFQTRW